MFPACPTQMLLTLPVLMGIDQVRSVMVTRLEEQRSGYRVGVGRLNIKHV